MKFLYWFFHFFCSIRLAVCTLSLLILLFATGTIYESFYGRVASQEVIYQSIGMNFLLFLLALNIIAVMIDRWPWQKRHIGFLTAHFGILIVLFGSSITRLYGIDGNLRLALNEAGSKILTDSTLLTVYSSFDTENLTELHKEEVKFFRHSPTQDHPHLVPLGSDVLQVVSFEPATFFRENYKTSPRGGPALRFQIEGKNAGFVRWLFKPPRTSQVVEALGPAQLVLLESFRSFQAKRPSLLLVPSGKNLQYELHHPSLKQVDKGVLKVGSVLKTGWMDFRFRLLNYLPKALPDRVFTPVKKVGDNTIPAIQLEFKGKKKWMGLNSHLFFFDENKVLVVGYMNERKNLGFQIQLKSFKIDYYPSSTQASAYESQVLVNQKHSQLISMNEPMKFAGYTIYQSGFEENEKGQPLASIFAINKDPGRWFKYIGSLLIIMGSLVLFFNRNVQFQKKMNAQ